MNRIKSKASVAIIASIMLTAVSASGGMHSNKYGNALDPGIGRYHLFVSTSAMNSTSNNSPPASQNKLRNLGAMMRFPVSDGYAFDGVNEIYALPYFLALVVVGVFFAFIALMPNPYRMSGAENRNAPANPKTSARNLQRKPYNRRITDNNSFAASIHAAPKTMQ
jgi:hypothetical protein